MHQATQKILSHRARKGYFLLQNKPTSLNPSPASLIFLPLFPYSSPFSLQTQGGFVCSRAGPTCHSWFGVTAITVISQIFISSLFALLTARPTCRFASSGQSYLHERNDVFVWHYTEMRTCPQTWDPSLNVGCRNSPLMPHAMLDLCAAALLCWVGKHKWKQIFSFFFFLTLIHDEDRSTGWGITAQFPVSSWSL